MYAPLISKAELVGRDESNFMFNVTVMSGCDKLLNKLLDTSNGTPRP